MTVAIALEDLGKSFRGHLGIGRKDAVTNLSLTVHPGEIFGLLGHNGAGKTTTLKMMLDLLRPDRGRVLLFGRPPSDAEVRRRIGFLPENPYFYDYLTASEFLDFYARLQGIHASERRDRIAAILRRVGLEGQGSVALRKFSKGMVQRLGLAQALQHTPDLVILDEPMSGLDPVGRREVRDLILEQKAAGRTVFFSSHILQDAELICDRVAILYRGTLRSCGRLDAMISRTVRWFEVSVAGALPPGFKGERLSAGDGETLVRVPDVAALTELLAGVAASGGQVTSVWPRRDTLEDLFLDAMAQTPAGARP